MNDEVTNDRAVISLVIMTFVIYPVNSDRHLSSEHKGVCHVGA
jgi:hypothetical protein